MGKNPRPSSSAQENRCWWCGRPQADRLYWFEFDRSTDEIIAEFLGVGDARPLCRFCAAGIHANVKYLRESWGLSNKPNPDAKSREYILASCLEDLRDLLRREIKLDGKGRDVWLKRA